MSMKSTKRPATSGEGMTSGMPKPLLDFTPQFKEAPQWDRSKKGKGVKGVEGVPLVEVATTHEAAMVASGMGPETMLLRRD
ncbi:hypothetical protein LSUE1_G009530, partial [Lachnellula suecica]